MKNCISMILLSFLLFGCTTSWEVPPVLEVAESLPAEEQMAHNALIGIIAEFYTQNQRWPTSKEELKNLEINDIPAKDLAKLVYYFRSIQMIKEDENLVLVYTYKSRKSKERIVDIEPAENNDLIFLGSRIR